MNNQTTIEKNVMRRVRIIRTLRPFTSMGALSVVVLALALYGIGREVWVAKVFANSPGGLLGHSLYLFYAFEHTRIAVQALSLLTLAALIYLARETARFVSEVLRPVRA